MINPFHQNEQSQIGLFTFYKSQQQQSIIRNKNYDLKMKRGWTQNPQEGKDQSSNFIANKKLERINRQVQSKTFNNRLLCQYFLRNTRLKTQSNRTPKALGAELPSYIDKTERRKEETTSCKELLIIEQRKVNIQKGISSDSKNQTDIVRSNNAKLHESIQTIRKKYFKSKLFSKTSHQPSQGVGIPSKLKLKTNAQMLRAHLYPFDKDLINQTIKDKDKSLEETVSFYDRKKQKQIFQNRKMSIRHKPIENQSTNWLKVKKIIQRIDNDQLLYNNFLNKKAYVKPEVKSLSYRLKTEGNHHQSNKFATNIWQTFSNFNKIALKEREASLKFQNSHVEAGQRLNSFK